ncbi:MAG: aldose 1-epimerase family protein [Clostridia bacterium]|nr:aldose 1-epimerase family protein [Clostridia bacterium]
MRNCYIGHESQYYGVEEHRLVGGKGDGMRLLQVRNGVGLEFTVSLDRAADISRLSFGGVNFGYFAACGYVAPAYYDGVGTGFLKSFNAGFLTTCGLNNIGAPCEDDGEVVPQHGTIGNTPAEHVMYYIENDEIHIKAKMRDAILFGRKFILEREYTVPLHGNTMCITDKVTNIGTSAAPLQVLYHFNAGYPLLTEDTELKINAERVSARSELAMAELDTSLIMEKPQAGYAERCFFYDIKGEANISVYNPKLNKGFVMSYDTSELPYFCEWKMMGEGDYVLGVEPSTSPLGGGRAKARADGLLEYLQAGETKVQHINFKFI